MLEATLSDAIQKQRCLSGLYGGLLRHFAPHALGAGIDDAPHVFVFQYAGESSGGLPRGRTRSNYSLQRQRCLARIDLAVPTSS